jgi:hypothetical protein
MPVITPSAAVATEIVKRDATGINQNRVLAPVNRRHHVQNHGTCPRGQAVSLLADLMMWTVKPRLRLNPYNQSCLLQVVKAHQTHGLVTDSLGV